MATKFGTSIAKGADGYKAGQDAAKKALAKIGNAKVDFSIVFASSKFNYQDVVRAVREATGKAPLIGCSTAGEFSDEAVGNEGVGVALISSDAHKFHTGMGMGLKTDEIKCFEQATKGFPLHSSLADFPHRSFIILQDGLCGKGEEVSLAALGTMGPDLKIAGGSAGDDYKFKGTSVFANDTVASNAIVTSLLLSKNPLAIGVDHGHAPISSPFTVTKAVGNKVYELDGKPAVKVFMDATREHAKKIGIDVDKMWDQPDQLGKFSFIYEGGLLTGKGYKIRWSGINANTRDHLPFVCSIPEGAVMRIMEGTKQSQIDSARNAASYALKGMGGRKIAGAVVFDCAVRGALLGGEFYKAVDEIKRTLGNVPLLGFETYGEIGLEEGQLSGFHNTTTVVLLFPD